MMSTRFVLLSTLLVGAPLAAHAGEQLIPAGSLLQCTLSEPKLSSKTANIGDPVLCRVSHVELYGRSTIPYGSYLVGRFDNYKDPGHLVGKGWMELKFDRLIIQPDTVVPVDAKVVNVPGYNVDREGRILGKGHPVRDVVEWSIPLLWPIDLINLPRRGPRPTLREETRLTLKVMDDIGVPTPDAPQQPPTGLQQRAPVSYVEPTPAYDPAPEQAAYTPEPQAPAQRTYTPQPYSPRPYPVQWAPAYVPGGPPPGTPVVVMNNGAPYRTYVR